jgi:nicotinate phosphoribosyltransferase
VISPLLTDLYQLTMAYGYWKWGLHEREAVFHSIFRKNPFGGNYAITCGLATAIDFLKDWRFQAEDLAYLANLRLPNQEKLFPKEFLIYLKNLCFSCDVEAILEGTLVFANEPLLRIKGPLLQGQLLESTLLNIINFQTLIATKASRVCQAAQGDPVLEFGMRRAQGPDGALSASRAAYIGGCTATSNVLAGKLYDIPICGTHAHSWVTAFPDEISSFTAFAAVMPHDCILLVDTYDTLQGVKNAIEVGKKLRAQGSDLQGIRLDSGDLAALSIKARQLLDEAGFTQTKIIASNNLNEHVIAEIKRQGAPISTWGVGTHLVTAYDHAALDGVYKLSALRNTAGEWQYKLKLSEQTVKVSNPGIYQVRRFFNQQRPIMDVLYDIELGITSLPEIISLETPHNLLKLENATEFSDLLTPIFRQGRLIYQPEPIHILRARGLHQINQFSQGNIIPPYLLCLEKQLHELKQLLIKQAATEANKNG